MNFNLTDEQKSFQSLARDFANKELAPYAAKWDAEKFFPKEVIKKSANMGFCGLYLKEDVGGLSCSRLKYNTYF